jgi:general secretion pathway protein E
LARIPKLDLRKPCGCPACRGSGFLGRTTIAEIMRIDAPLARLIRRGVTAGDLDAQARANGMVSILDNGLDKVATGETTLAEVVKVVRI